MRWPAAGGRGNRGAVLSGGNEKRSESSGAAVAQTFILALGFTAAHLLFQAGNARNSSVQTGVWIQPRGSTTPL